MRRHRARGWISAGPWALLSLVPGLSQGQGIFLRVQDLDGAPIRGVVLRAQGWPAAAASDDGGQILLQEPGSWEGAGWLTLKLGGELGPVGRWMFVHPWNRKLWVSSSSAGERLSEPVVLAERGDPRLLADDRALGALAAELAIRKLRRRSPESRESAAEREAAVAEVAEAVGLAPGELAGALERWRGGEASAFGQGLAALGRGADDKARELLTRAWQERREAADREPAAAVDAAFFLALALQRLDEFGGSAFLLRRADELRADDATILAALGRALHFAGDSAGALRELAKVLAIEEGELGGDDPRLAPTLANLALVCFATGDLDRAEALYRRALTLDEAALGPDHPAVAIDLNNLASIRASLGDLPAAQELLERALAIREAKLASDAPEVATSLNNLAVIHFEQGRLREARELNRRALVIDEAALGPEHPSVATDLANLALVSDRLGLTVEAEDQFRRALEIRDQVLEPTHPDLARSLDQLAWFLHRQGRLDEAEPLYRRALEILDAATATDSVQLALSLKHLGMLCQRQERYEEAEPLYRRALRIFEESAPESFELVSLLWSYADLLCQIGREEQGAELEKRAKELRARLTGGRPSS